MLTKPGPFLQNRGQCNKGVWTQTDDLTIEQ